MKPRIPIVFLCLALFAAVASAGPFGLIKGHPFRDAIRKFIPAPKPAPASLVAMQSPATSCPCTSTAASPCCPGGVCGPKHLECLAPALAPQTSHPAPPTPKGTVGSGSIDYEIIDGKQQQVIHMDGGYEIIDGKMHHVSQAAPVKGQRIEIIDGSPHIVVDATAPKTAAPPFAGPRPGPGPGPRPDFHPIGPTPFHGGYNGWGGGWRSPIYVNPFNYVAPVIADIATAPRMIVNPSTGQSQLMSPGAWTVINAGTPQQAYIWSALPVWPLVGSSAATASTAAPVAVVKSAGPCRRFVHRIFHRRRSRGWLRKVVKAIRNPLYRKG